MYESAFYNIKAHLPIAQAIRRRTADVHFIKVGSSHVLYGGVGQSNGLVKAIHDLGYGVINTGLLSQSENATFSRGGAPGDTHSLPDTGTEGLLVAPNTWATGAGVGYGFSGVATPSRAALSLFPANMLDYVVKGWSGTVEQNPGMGHLQPWLGSATKTDNNTGIRTDGVTDTIRQAQGIRGWIFYYDDPTLTGNISIGWRAEGPTVQIKSKNVALGGTAGLKMAFCDLTEEEALDYQHPRVLKFQVSNTLGSLSKLTVLGACVESLASRTPWGMSCSPLVFYGGAGARLIKSQVVSAFDAYHGYPFVYALASTRSGAAKKYVVDLSLGHNDRNDTALSADGVNNSNTVAGLLANAEALITATKVRLANAMNVSFSDIFFRLRIDTPVSFPDNATLVAYRSALYGAINNFHQTVLIDAMELGSAAEYATWWVNPPTDQVHLNATGYNTIESRQMQGYVSKLNALLASRSSFWNHELTGG